MGIDAVVEYFTLARGCVGVIAGLSREDAKTRRVPVGRSYTGVKASRESARSCTHESDLFPGLAPGSGPWWLSPWGWGQGRGRAPYTLTLVIRIRADNARFGEMWLIWLNISHTIPVVCGNRPPPLKTIGIMEISWETDCLGAEMRTRRLPGACRYHRECIPPSG